MDYSWLRARYISELETPTPDIERLQHHLHSLGVVYQCSRDPGERIIAIPEREWERIMINVQYMARESATHAINAVIHNKRYPNVDDFDFDDYESAEAIDRAVWESWDRVAERLLSEVLAGEHQRVGSPEQPRTDLNAFGGEVGETLWSIYTESARSRIEEYAYEVASCQARYLVDEFQGSNLSSASG